MPRFVRVSISLSKNPLRPESRLKPQPTASIRPALSAERKIDEHRRLVSGHNRSDPRLLGDPKKLGALEGPLREPRLSRPHPGLPRLRGGGRGAQLYPL